jgi:hypothetical protein
MKDNFTDNIKDTLIDKDVKKPVNSEVNKPVFNIPQKVIERTDTQSFTITSKKTLIKELDKMYKKKGYKSRNELINVMLELVLNSSNE